MSKLLNHHQSLKTTAAKGATTFEIEGHNFAAFPQFSEDIPGVKSTLDSGNSDVNSLIYRLEDGELKPHQQIPAHGARNIDAFIIEGRHFIAISCLRSGPGEPYNINTYSMVYAWDGKFFVPFQQFYTRSAKNCYTFQIGSRHFLAIAKGEKLDPNDTPDDTSASIIYEWNGESFVDFQTIPSMAGFNWQHTEIEGNHYLMIIDGTIPSTIYKWNGEQFESFQTLDSAGGRNAIFFNIDDERYLAVAYLSAESKVYRWNGTKFENFQVLAEVGGHNVLFFTHDGTHYLMRANYIGGSRTSPITKLDSQLYAWQGSSFELAETYTTYGGSGLASYYENGKLFIVQSNSHSEEIQFRVDSVVWRFGA